MCAEESDGLEQATAELLSDCCRKLSKCLVSFVLWPAQVKCVSTFWEASYWLPWPLCNANKSRRKDRNPAHLLTWRLGSSSRRVLNREENRVNISST